MNLDLIETAKAFLVEVLSLSRDSLHVHIGLGVFWAVALLLRMPVRTWRPWLAVFLLATLGEVVDLSCDQLRYGHLRWDASVHDIVNTVFWPTVLTLLQRWAPGFERTRRPGRVDEHAR